jgi:hypothetical protein
MVSASRHFAHYYSDKVVKRTKWSIFVPGAKGRQRWLVPHRLRPTTLHVLQLHHRAVIVALKATHKAVFRLVLGSHILESFRISSCAVVALRFVVKGGRHEPGIVTGRRCTVQIFFLLGESFPLNRCTGQQVVELGKYFLVYTSALTRERISYVDVDVRKLPCKINFLRLP